MGNKQEEKLVFEICCKYLNLNKADFLDIKLTEKPDIQTIGTELGIEVTQVIQPKEGELENFFNQIRGLSKQEILFQANKNKKLKKYIESEYIIPSNITNGVIFPVNDNLYTIINSIHNKLEKKKFYRKLNKNILFLIIEFQFIDKNYIEECIISEIKKEENNLSSKFDNYILYDKWKNILYIIDENYSVRIIK